MWTALLALSFCAHAALEITEFSTNSDNRALDEDGESVDWIELRNVGNSPISTLGYTLTDDRNEPAKWPLPDVRLSPGGFLLVFASGKDRSNPGAELHAGFSLTSSPGHLALFEPDGITRSSAFDYPRQFYGVSFGAGGYFGTPPREHPTAPLISPTLSGIRASAPIVGSTKIQSASKSRPERRVRQSTIPPMPLFLRRPMVRSTPALSS